MLFISLGICNLLSMLCHLEHYVSTACYDIAATHCQLSGSSLFDWFRVINSAKKRGWSKGQKIMQT